MKHAHCELIKAWADGAIVEYFNGACNKWAVVEFPKWNIGVKYRIKPEEPDYGHIALRGYADSFPSLDRDMCWKAAADAVIEAYKKHHNLP